MGSVMPLHWEVLCCLRVVAHSMALQGSLPRRLLILAEERPLIPTMFGAAIGVSAVLPDCFPVQICSFAGYFASFMFDQEKCCYCV